MYQNMGSTYIGRFLTSQYKVPLTHSSDEIIIQFKIKSPLAPSRIKNHCDISALASLEVK